MLVFEYQMREFGLPQLGEWGLADGDNPNHAFVTFGSPRVGNFHQFLTISQRMRVLLITQRKNIS